MKQDPTVLSLLSCLGPHMINNTATAIAHEAQAIMPSDYIAGVAVILPVEVLE